MPNTPGALIRKNGLIQRNSAGSNQRFNLAGECSCCGGGGGEPSCGLAFRIFTNGPFEFRQGKGVRTYPIFSGDGFVESYELMGWSANIPQVCMGPRNEFNETDTIQRNERIVIDVDSRNVTVTFFYSFEQCDGTVIERSAGSASFTTNCEEPEVSLVFTLTIEDFTFPAQITIGNAPVTITEVDHTADCFTCGEREISIEDEWFGSSRQPFWSPCTNPLQAPVSQRVRGYQHASQTGGEYDIDPWLIDFGSGPIGPQRGNANSRLPPSIRSLLLVESIDKNGQIRFRISNSIGASADDNPSSNTKGSRHLFTQTDVTPPVLSADLCRLRSDTSAQLIGVVTVTYNWRRVSKFNGTVNGTGTDQIQFRVYYSAIPDRVLFGFLSS